MTKKERKLEGATEVAVEKIVQPEANLSPSVRDAIQEAVAKAVVEAVSAAIPALVNQLSPAANPIPEKIFSDQINPTKPAKPYKKINRGYPVQEGQSWHDLTPEQRRQWMNEHENRWKQNFNTKTTGMQQDMSWTRG